MDKNFLPTEFFIAQIKSFADSFPSITIKEEEWGLIFEWPNSKHITTNMAIINENPSDKMEYLINWLKEAYTRKILVLEDIILPRNTVKEYELGIYYR